MTRTRSGWTDKAESPESKDGMTSLDDTARPAVCQLMKSYNSVILSYFNNKTLEIFPAKDTIRTRAEPAAGLVAATVRADFEGPTAEPRPAPNVP
jgi:hypothetical protein